MSVPDRLAPPSRTFPLGTDEFGRDILSRLVYGARISLTVGCSAVLIAAAGGTLIGTVAGYASGLTEQVLMRFVDGVLAFPAFMLAIFVVVFVGTQLPDLIVTIGVLYLPRFARVAHGMTLATKRLDYVEAARAVGAPDPRILRRAILPSVAAPTIVQMSLALGDAILLESGLSFLGLGPPPPTPTWGRIIAESARFMERSAYVVIWPSLAIAVTVLAFNLLGDAVRDALDPRLAGEG